MTDYGLVALVPMKVEIYFESGQLVPNVFKESGNLQATVNLSADLIGQRVAKTQWLSLVDVGLPPFRGNAGQIRIGNLVDDLKLAFVHQIIVKEKNDRIDKTGKQIGAGFHDSGRLSPDRKDVRNERIGTGMDDQVK